MNTRALVAELIGTFAIVLVAIFANVHFAGVSGGLFAIALTNGLGVAAFATTFASVSGSHFNPAVSASLLVTKRIDFQTFWTYVIAQISGGLLAGFVAFAVQGKNAALVGTSAPKIDGTFFAAFLMEFIVSAFLVFSIWGTAINKSAPKVGALFIGFAVAIGILIAGPISGAAMNPARWLGPSVFGGADLANAALFFPAPILGAIFAAVVFEKILIGQDSSGDTADSE